MKKFGSSFSRDFSEVCGNQSSPSISNFTFLPKGANMDTSSRITIVPDPSVFDNPIPAPAPKLLLTYAPVDPAFEEDSSPIHDQSAEELDETIETFEENWFRKSDIEGIAEVFVEKHYTDGEHRLIHYFDGHLHCYNGTFYEKLTNSNMQLLRRKMSEYVRTLQLVGKKGELEPAPTTPQFYKQFETALVRICDLTEKETKEFKTQPSHLVYGKTRVWDMETDTFQEYHPSIQTNYTLDHDVAETDDEPEVWQEFFDKSGMDGEQQRAWWYMLSVILMRDKKHHRLFYLFGNPRSGKGMTSEICRAMFGRERATGISGDMSGRHATSIIVGKLLLTLDDMKFDQRTNRYLVKLLLNVVGDDPVPIDPKRKELFDYFSEANLVITSNEMPNFKGNLSGLEKKFAFLVFQRTGEEEDLSLKPRMMATMPEIIRKAATVYREVVASGYAFDTEQGKVIAKQFLEGSSVARAFVEEECVIGEGYQIGTVELYQVYRMYAGERGEPHQSESDFAREIMTLHLGQIDRKRINVPGSKKVKGRYDKVTVFKGICLAPPSEQVTSQSRATIDDALNPNPTALQGVSI